MDLIMRPWTGADDAVRDTPAPPPDPGRHTFAVVRGAEVLGRVVLKLPDAEVGYWTAPHARRQGVAAWGLRQLTRWAFARYAMPTLALLHQVDNEASCAVARRCGYAFERELAPGGGYPLPGHRHVRHRDAG
ncbi:RimJ/RimL family protein N-acetyltransferase [Actinoplanes octamycinicus]|uniref:RimJ/RimL family protein N-acetyltransferase n=1 Tax=Actinoplanes octamycinicus TaxID=135948 RepID=A0A7W7MA30_9ACTN|nr:GNAT family N-acetyltransferase [Actinoplanes octamycinicus]MBB4742609.1 RimJ/RimL family protein N-acetyltransferase [Actinoplanes octamycinicus]GIE60947.1 hypothetical protein Aoc01nite_63490 [Actinoplanes octamycinicus]